MFRDLFNRLIHGATPATAQDGYSHPALKDAFRDAAMSAKGRAIIGFCKETGFRIEVSDRLAPSEAGVCDSRRMKIRPGSNFRVLAHEARHAHQMNKLGVRCEELTANPLALHVVKRMVEADAYAFENMVALEQFVAQGWHTVYDIPHGQPIDMMEFVSLEAFSIMCHLPVGHALIMRGLFDEHFRNLAQDPEKQAYEKRFLALAEDCYEDIHDALTTPKWLMLYTRRELQDLVGEFRDTARIVGEAARKLGSVPEMSVNYLEGVGDGVASPRYMDMFPPESRQVHAYWQDKINAVIRERHAPV